MGGKGGGGGGGTMWTRETALQDEGMRGQMKKQVQQMEKDDPDSFKSLYGEGGVDRAFYLNLFPPEPAPVAEPVVEAAPVVEEPKVETPVVEEKKDDTAKPIGDPITAGGAVDQPKAADNTGDLLGGAVLSPPKYWVGNTYKRPGSKGSLTTTQT
jgi:hypothetical protein